MNIAKLKKMARNISVLFVEDDEASRESVYKILLSIFPDVIAETDGARALKTYKKRARKNKFDLVITDLSLGDMDGIDVIREMKRIDPEQTVIVLSAHEQANIFLDAIDSGVDSYLLKPLDPSKFFETLRRSIKAIAAKKASKAYRLELELQLLQQSQLINNMLTLDEQTGLLSESSFFEYLKYNNGFFALALLKIDNLSNIKNFIGKEYSNFYIKEIAEKIAAELDGLEKRPNIYRIDFDELAIVLEYQISESKEIIGRLGELGKYFFCQKNGISLNSGFTIGLYYGCSDMYYNAKAVLNMAEEEAKGSFIALSEETATHENIHKNLYWLKKFSESIEHNMVVPYFQPIMDNSINKITKYECLARIVDNGAIVEPGKFINIASKIRQTPFLTKIIIQKAFEYFEDKNKDVEFSINLSLQDLQDDTVFEHIDICLQTYKIAPRRVVFEILETEDIYKQKTVKSKLKKLKDSGFKLAVDDFGTGYSNFIYLHEFAVDYIKIDGSFIKNIDKDDSLPGFVSYIDKLIKLSGAKSIAEFVANEKIKTIVNDIGIDFSQGYAIGKPQKEIQ